MMNKIKNHAMLGSVMLACMVALSCANPATPTTASTTASHSVAFVANGGTGSMASQSIAEGATVALSANAFTKSGCDFAGWATSASASSAAYGDGASYTMGSADVTLYAVWLTPAIYYDMNGSGLTAPAQQDVGTAITVQASPAQFYQATGVAWYSFKGWNTKADGSGSAYAAGDSLTASASLTLYAQWKALAVGDLGPAGGYIFYVADSYQADAVNGDWRYMEIGTEDLQKPNTTPAEYVMPFSGNEVNSNIVSTSASIGAGLANTRAIYAAIVSSTNDFSTTGAVRACQASSQGGKTDWFLPSTEELQKAYTELHAKSLGSFSADVYYASVALGDSAFCAGYVDFNDGSSGSCWQTDSHRVRAARRF